MVALRISGRAMFVAAALGLLIGAAVHGIAYSAGPHWISLLGAPPSVIGSARRGTWLAPIDTLIIMTCMAGLSLCCFSCAGVIRQLPFTRTVLSVAAPIFIIRGLIAVPMLLTGHAEWRTPIGRFNPAEPVFMTGSVVVLVIGLAMLGGLAMSADTARHVEGSSS